MRALTFAAVGLVLGLGSPASAREPAGKGAIHSFSFSRGGLKSRSFRAEFGPNGKVSLSTNVAVVVPNFLTMRNLVLYDRTRQVRVSPELSSALQALQQQATAAGVGSMQTHRYKPQRGDRARPILHWQAPGSVISNIETARGPGLGKIAPASASVRATYRAATLVEQLARSR